MRVKSKSLADAATAIAGCGISSVHLKEWLNKELGSILTALAKFGLVGTKRDRWKGLTDLNARFKKKNLIQIDISQTSPTVTMILIMTLI